MDQTEKSKAKDRVESKILVRGERVLDTGFDLVDKLATRFTGAAQEKLGISTFVLSLEGLATMLNALYQDLKSMGRKGYRSKVSFIEFANTTLMQYWSVIDRAEVRDDVVDSMRKQCVITIGKAVDDTLDAANWRPRKAIFGRKKFTKEQIEAEREAKLDEVVPEIIDELTNFCQSQHKVVTLAISMSNIEARTSRPGGDKENGT